MFQTLSNHENGEEPQTEIQDEFSFPAIESEPIIPKSTPTSSQFPPRRSQKRKAMTNNDDISAINNAIHKLDKLSQQNQNATGDEFDAFAQLIAIQLRQLPLLNALSCQEKIQSLIKEERMKVLLKNTASHIASSPSSHYPNSDCSNQEVWNNSAPTSPEFVEQPNYSLSSATEGTSDIIYQALANIQ